MRKIILYMASSIDGFIASPDGDVSWIETEVDLGDDENNFEVFLKRIDTIIMGRKSYEQTQSFGKWPFKNHRIIVFSKSLLEVQTPNTTIVSDPTPEFIHNLKKEEGVKDIWLFGGGITNHFFLEHNLIDEIMLFVQPIVLGNGLGIFGNMPVSLKTFLRKEGKELKHGFTLLWYTHASSK